MELLNRFETKLLRGFVGPTYENAPYEEFYTPHDEELSPFIRIQRLKWLGHVLRMKDSRTVRKLYKSFPGGA